MDKTSLDLLLDSRVSDDSTVFDAEPLRSSFSSLLYEPVGLYNASLWPYLLPLVPILTHFWFISKQSAFLPHSRCLFQLEKVLYHCLQNFTCVFYGDVAKTKSNMFFCAHFFFFLVIYEAWLITALVCERLFYHCILVSVFNVFMSDIPKEQISFLVWLDIHQLTLCDLPAKLYLKKHRLIHGLLK